MLTVILCSSHNLAPVKDNQVLLIDVYSKWTGPCIAAESYLRRIRHAFVEAPECLVLARACCDNIEELEAFKQYVNEKPYLRLQKVTVIK